MSLDDKEGAYCGVCGGISPSKVTVRQVEVGGKSVGIDRLEEAILEVRALDLSDDDAIVEELLRRVRANNYVPSSRAGDYGQALLEEYRRSG